MKRWLTLVIVCTLLTSFLVEPRQAALAQAPTPPNAGVQPQASQPPLPLPAGIQQDARGSLYVSDASLAARSGVITPQTLSAQGPATGRVSGPAQDKFGYRRVSAPVNWVDATGGEDLGISASEQAVYVALPFNFPFYQNRRPVVAVTAYGYLTFDYGGEDLSYVYLPQQSQIPSSNTPNEVIAPYWTPAVLGSTGRVFYHQPATTWVGGAEAGLKYVVFEWYRMDGNWGNVFTFEVILFENGTILIQNEQMTPGDQGNWYCGTAGIENDTGLVGLNALRFCDWPASMKAWKFIRPKPTARPYLQRTALGGFASPNGSVRYPVEIFNAGDLGADTFDLSISSKWPARFYDAGGVVPLADTDADGKPDTGLLPQSEARTVWVEVQIPAGTPAGRANTATLMVRSSLNRARLARATLTSAVPDRFALSYYSGTLDNASKIYLAAPEAQKTVEARDDNLLQQLPDSSFLQAAAQYTDTGSELHLYRLDGNGNLLADYTLASTEGTSDDFTAQAIAVTPNGAAYGVLFRRWVGATQSYKLVLGIYRPAETTPYSEVDLSSAVPALYSTSPGLAATADNHFVAVWTAYQNDPNYGQVSSAWGAVVQLNGAYALRKFSPDASAGRGYGSQVTRLADGRILVAYIGLDYAKLKLGDQLIVSTWDSNLTAAFLERKLGPGDGVTRMTQLPNGKILIGWGRSTYTAASNMQYRLVYTLLRPDTLAPSTGLRKVLLPAGLDDSLNFGLTYDTDGNGVIMLGVYQDDSGMDVLYTRVSGKNGAVLTKTMSILASLDVFYTWFDTASLTTNLP